MYSLEMDYTYLVKIATNNITEAKRIADKHNCCLYQDGKLIYIPNNRKGLINHEF
ncbi:MAG TPA: hypothetical protein VFD03_04480 [Clostridia bacterium]|nr:hypothetical protein [Clostridia bacterium]